MLFRILVSAQYFKVVVCENIAYENLYHDFYNNVYLDYYINNEYTIKFDCVVTGYNHIWTSFICEKHLHDEDRDHVYMCQPMTLLTKISFINKAISNKNIAKLFNIYREYINNYKFVFLSNDVYKTVCNLKNKWVSFENSIRAFKFL